MDSKKSNSMETVKFSVIPGRNVRVPERAHKDDAGIDIFAPLDMEPKVLNPGESLLIQTGLKCVCPKGYAMVVMNKSGVSIKKTLIRGACLIDENYRGEIGIHMINVGCSQQSINPGDKIIQVILLPVGYHDIEMVSSEEYELYSDTSRGEGAYGSTGN